MTFPAGLAIFMNISNVIKLGFYSMVALQAIYMVHIFVEPTISTLFKMKEHPLWLFTPVLRALLRNCTLYF